MTVSILLDVIRRIKVWSHVALTLFHRINNSEICIYVYISHKSKLSEFKLHVSDAFIYSYLQSVHSTMKTERIQ